MPFRAKVKRAFGGKKKSDATSSGSTSPPKRTDIEYYKPHEIPRPKYRGPWNQKHQELLHSFSFSEAFHKRKNSIPSSYSPRGTNAQSRRSSWVSKARSSLGGRSSDKEDIGAAKRKSTGSHVGPVIEDVDDDADVGNVGLSRKVTTEQQRSSQDANRLGLEKTVTQSQLRQENEQPFTPEELSKAITAAAVK